MFMLGGYSPSPSGPSLTRIFAHACGAAGYAFTQGSRAVFTRI
jgi:hypothetical protein